MLRYAASKFQQALLTIFLLLTFTFVVIRFTGDPTVALLPMTASPEERLELRESLRLEDPLPEQYLAYLGDMATGDFGRSYRWQRPVMEVIAQRLPVTVTLAFWAGCITLFLGLPLGVLAARMRGRASDHLIQAIALIGQSVPIFVTALAAILIFSVNLRWLPVAGTESALGYVLPSATLGWFGLAAVIRVTRVSMLDVLGAEYVLTARAKGLKPHAVLYGHALRNALIPILTIFSLILATLLTGTVVTETMFGMPGLGRLLVESIIDRDFPVVQGVILLTTVLFVGVNMLVDVLYGVIDPRTRRPAS
jgi:ABC-type dipeptide/oligopeptide/nickel transport system permease component